MLYEVITRLGYICTANNDFLSKLRKLLPVWNINTLAEFFLKNLHATNNIYHKARIRVISDVSYLYTSISKIPGFYIYPTGSNFILIKSECGLNATELQQLLLEKYYLYVRDCSNKIGVITSYSIHYTKLYDFLSFLTPPLPFGHPLP